MVVLDQALRVVNNPEEFKFEDFVEALQVINDLGRTDLLNQQQKLRLWGMVEQGLVFAPIVKL